MTFDMGNLCLCPSPSTISVVEPLIILIVVILVLFILCIYLVVCKYYKSFGSFL